MTIEPRMRAVPSRIPRLMLVVLLVVGAALALLSCASHHELPGGTAPAPAAVSLTFADAAGAAAAAVAELASHPADTGAALGALACVCVLMLLAAAGIRRRVETVAPAPLRGRPATPRASDFARVLSGRTTLSLLSVARV
ncbi:MAG: hypothetical protein DI534_06685 [Leifsonia xyli]|nr:MAG: hypothetical protein DI534_06685 [Leifsonia xyli]